MVASERSRSAESGPRVLLIDDEVSLAETLADGLEERGYRATAIGSSADAAAILRANDPTFDAIVTDLRMPGIDGLALVSLAKERVPERPVLVVTAFGSLDRAIESLRRGACHYLNKPFKVDELAVYLERALEDARVRREADALRRALADRAGPFAAPLVPLQELTQRYVAWAHRHLGGRGEVTAERLGVDERTLAALLAEHEAAQR